VHFPAAYSEETDCVGFARLGSEDQKIVAGTMRQLQMIDFGTPLHCLVIVGKTHPVEDEMLDFYRLKGESLEQIGNNRVYCMIFFLKKEMILIYIASSWRLVFLFGLMMIYSCSFNCKSIHLIMLDLLFYKTLLILTLAKICDSLSLSHASHRRSALCSLRFRLSTLTLSLLRLHRHR
jgi:hypothetical protein